MRSIDADQSFAIYKKNRVQGCRDYDEMLGMFRLGESLGRGE